MRWCRASSSGMSSRRESWRSSTRYGALQDEGGRLIRVVTGSSARAESGLLRKTMSATASTLFSGPWLTNRVVAQSMMETLSSGLVETKSEIKVIVPLLFEATDADTLLGRLHRLSPISPLLLSHYLSFAVVQGHLHTYRFCDGVWIFHLEKAEYRPDTKTPGQLINCDAVKIIASDSNL